MGRQINNLFLSVKEEFANKGAEVVCPEEVITSKSVIQFKCSSCKSLYHIRYEAYKGGQNPNLYCKECQFKFGSVGKQILDICKENNVRLIEMFKGKHPAFSYECPSCGEPVKVYVDNIMAGKTSELKCKYCRSHAKVISEDSLKREFQDLGSEILSKYENFHTPFKFRCTKCGGEGSITLRDFRAGKNRNLVCSSCSKVKKTPIEEIRKIFESKGATLLSKEYHQNQDLEFLCSNCGKPWHINWSNFAYLNENPDLLCDECYSGRSMTTAPSNERTKIENYWFQFVFEFYNIPHSKRKDYAAHHIWRYSLYPDYRTSITNGYPLILSEHKGNSRFYHFTPQGRDIKNWTDAAKLWYHIYPDFTWLDINPKFISEILHPQTDMSESFLLERKRTFQKQNLTYFPIYLSDMLTLEKREIVYSMIRNRLYKHFPQIYEFTGTKLTRLYARNLSIKEVKTTLAAKFFEATHIQGSTAMSYALGLYNEDTLVSCMTFSKPRNFSKVGENYEWEILRFSNLLNTVVIGGASKLFKEFIKQKSPQSVVSFCDIRFSSLNPEETVYPKLNFSYEGLSRPNYRYRDPVFFRTYSRQVFQKQYLPQKLQEYDETLSEFENMKNNGYIRQYDCGNFKFVWRVKNN